MSALLSQGTIAALVCTALLLAACGGAAPQRDAPPAAPLDNPVDPARAGHVTGTVLFEGTAPPPQPINMRSDPYCVRENPGATVQSIVVGAGGGVQHVFVYVKEGLEHLRFPVPSTPVVLDQRRCIYEPRVFGIQVGQPLELLNSDSTLHNVHAAAVANREFNRGQAREGDTHTHVFSTAEVMVPFKCDVHRWMNAWVGVVDHPFHASTGTDGTFRLDGLPPGTYTIEAWHETLGAQTQTVTIDEQETRDISFTFRI